jgi:hypothetical protein
MLFAVYGKLVEPWSNLSGDNWKQKLRKRLAKDLPALTP